MRDMNFVFMRFCKQKVRSHSALVTGMTKASLTMYVLILLAVLWSGYYKFTESLQADQSMGMHPISTVTPLATRQFIPL